MPKDPGRIARLIYTYIHLPVAGGIIVLAAADEIVLDHPLKRAGIGPAAVVVGGTALFLAGSMRSGAPCGGSGRCPIWRVSPASPS